MKTIRLCFFLSFIYVVFYFNHCLNLQIHLQRRAKEQKIKNVYSHVLFCFLVLLLLWLLLFLLLLHIISYANFV